MGESYDFTARITDDAHRAVIAVAGDIDMQTEAILTDALAEAMARSADVLLDLSDVDFMDSSGIGVIVNASEQCKAAGGALCLRGLQDTPMRVLEITGVLDHVMIEA